MAEQVRPVIVDLYQTLPGPPAVVWQLITDWEHQGDWMAEASDFVVTSPRREGVGVEATATIRIAGIRTRDAIRVDAWEPERHLGIEHLGWVKGRGDLWLEASDDGTALRWREILRPPCGILGAAGLRACRPMVVRTFRRDLALLSALVGRR